MARKNLITSSFDAEIAETQRTQRDKEGAPLIHWVNIGFSLRALRLCDLCVESGAFDD
jgi:hypothetical protein